MKGEWALSDERQLSAGAKGRPGRHEQLIFA